jgi:hypothetical protein
VAVLVGSGAAGMWLMPCVIYFLRYLDSLTVFESVEIRMILFESLLVSESVEICRFLCIWSTYFAPVLTVWERTAS